MAAIERDHIYIRNERSQFVGWRNGVAGAVDHERRLPNDRVRIRQQVPVAIKIPVPIDAARKTGFLEGRNENGQLTIAHQGFAERCFCSGEIDHRHARLRFFEGLVFAVEVAKEPERILVQNGVGHARLSIEMDEIIFVAKDLLQKLDPGELSALLVRQA